MIAMLDASFTRPGREIVARAAADGIRLWGGYIATRQNVGIAAPWSRADFDTVRLAGCTPIAFCSGADDPAVVRNMAILWGVRPCLDVERGIRDDGGWVQEWLDASGAGLYGNAPVHVGRRACFHILAAYPGSDPRATWAAGVPKPDAPCGWQWQGTHQEYGLSVDRSWLDDWFVTGEPPAVNPAPTAAAADDEEWLLHAT